MPCAANEMSNGSLIPSKFQVSEEGFTTISSSPGASGFVMKRAIVSGLVLLTAVAGLSIGICALAGSAPACPEAEASHGGRHLTESRVLLLQMMTRGGDVEVFVEKNPIMTERERTRDWGPFVSACTGIYGALLNWDGCGGPDYMQKQVRPMIKKFQAFGNVEICIQPFAGEFILQEFTCYTSVYPSQISNPGNHWVAKVYLSRMPKMTWYLDEVPSTRQSLSRQKVFWAKDAFWLSTTAAIKEAKVNADGIRNRNADFTPNGHKLPMGSVLVKVPTHPMENEEYLNGGTVLAVSPEHDEEFPVLVKFDQIISKEGWPGLVLTFENQENIMLITQNSGRTYFEYEPWLASGGEKMQQWVETDADQLAHLKDEGEKVQWTREMVYELGWQRKNEAGHKMMWTVELKSRNEVYQLWRLNRNLLNGDL